jgi:hypothetical protein
VNSQPATPSKPVKSRWKLGLILGLILGVGIGVGGCLPFIFDFQKKLEDETAAKTDVKNQLEQTKQTVKEKEGNIVELNGELANWKQNFDDESGERQRLDKEVEQLENEKAVVEKQSSEKGKQIEEQVERIAELKANNDALNMDKADLQRENQALATDLRQSQAMVSTLRAEMAQSSGIPPSERAPGKDGVMTVVGMTEDVTLSLDGPINTLRIVDWPSKKIDDRFCYESSRNGQKVTLYFNQVPFGTIEHKVLKGEDTLVLSWKEDSPLFWSDRAQKNRDVTFEKTVAFQLAQSDVAFLYESKIPTKEKFIQLKFVSE